MKKQLLVELGDMVNSLVKYKSAVSDSTCM